MSINGTTGVNYPIYEGANGAGGVGNTNESTSGNVSNTGADFSGVLSDALREQAMQSLMTRMAGSSGESGSFGGMNAMFGGTNSMLGLTGGISGPGAMMGMMPSISAGMENTLLSAAGTGEMSGTQLVLFVMIMMMQNSDSSGDMLPIMHMLAGMLTQTNNPATGDSQNNLMALENAQNYPGSDIKRMVDAALTEVGYRERNSDGSFGSGNRTKFGAWYGMDGQPWCAMFVSWAADQAGVLGDKVPRHASTSQGVKAYQEKGLYAHNSTGYIPKEGDAIYFQSPNGTIRHVGIVVGVDMQNQKVYTVEGNTDNAVRIRHYDLNSSYIHGYGQNGGTSLGRIPEDSSTGTGASFN